MSAVYFDSSVFIALFRGAGEAVLIGDLLRELKRDRVRICTSVITIQEVSVLSYRRGRAAIDNHARVNRLARIESVSKDIALTAAKFEATIRDHARANGAVDEDNPRRKWDCFHVATATCLSCNTLYTFDKGLLKRKKTLGLEIDFRRPAARTPSLFPDSPQRPEAPPAGLLT